MSTLQPQASPLGLLGVAREQDEGSLRALCQMCSSGGEPTEFKKVCGCLVRRPICNWCASRFAVAKTCGALVRYQRSVYTRLWLSSLVRATAELLRRDAVIVYTICSYFVLGMSHVLCVAAPHYDGEMCGHASVSCLLREP